MTNTLWKLQYAANILCAVFYIIGALNLLFPHVESLVRFDGGIALGVALLATGIFGSPYCTCFKKVDGDP